MRRAPARAVSFAVALLLAASAVAPVGISLAAAAPASRPSSPAAAADPAARQRKIVAAAYDQIGITLTYDAAYTRLEYPGGDVPPERGVCSDVVVRALRGIGLDLQQAVHEDMRAHFRAYPQRWGLRGADRNIDHRRVPNLETWFRRAGYEAPAGSRWRPGDIVSWRLPNGLPHIAIVADRPGSDGQWLVVHNIGQGTRVEAAAADWVPVGHFRLPPEPTALRGRAR